MARAGPLRAPRRRSLSGQQRLFSTPKASYRSGLEEVLARQITAAGQPIHFETYRIPFVQPAKNRHYTPDLTLNNGVIIEGKGIFTTDDRQKHIMVKAQHPALDIRFVFSNAKAKIAPKSPTTYAKWAEDHGFKWSHKVIPEGWLHEPPNPGSLSVLESLGFRP